MHVVEIPMVVVLFSCSYLGLCNQHSDVMGNDICRLTEYGHYPSFVVSYDTAASDSVKQPWKCVGKCFTWIHQNTLYAHNKMKHNTTVCFFYGIRMYISWDILCIPSRKQLVCQDNEITPVTDLLFRIFICHLKLCLNIPVLLSVLMAMDLASIV